jgi:hypothetical protein
LTSLPNFCTYCDLIFVSLYAWVLHCLLIVSNYNTIQEYTTNVKSWDLFLAHCQEVCTQFASTEVVSELCENHCNTKWHSASMGFVSSDLDLDGADLTWMPYPLGYMVFENAVLFLWDALISCEFTDAVKAGDLGWILLVLKVWAFSFWGSGSNISYTI